MDADANANANASSSANANPNTNADAGGSTTALRERCLGELKRAKSRRLTFNPTNEKADLLCGFKVAKYKCFILDIHVMAFLNEFVEKKNDVPKYRI